MSLEQIREQLEIPTKVEVEGLTILQLDALLRVLKKGGLVTNPEFKKIWEDNDHDEDFTALFHGFPNINCAKGAKTACQNRLNVYLQIPDGKTKNDGVPLATASTPSLDALKSPAGKTAILNSFSEEDLEELLKSKRSKCQGE